MLPYIFSKLFSDSFTKIIINSVNIVILCISSADNDAWYLKSIICCISIDSSCSQVEDFLVWILQVYIDEKIFVAILLIYFISLKIFSAIMKKHVLFHWLLILSSGVNILTKERSCGCWTCNANKKSCL